MNLAHSIQSATHDGATSGRIRAAFSGLAYLCVLLLGVIVGTSLAFYCTELLLQPLSESVRPLLLRIFVQSAMVLPPLPLLVAACNLAPEAGARRALWLIASTALYILACAVLPLTGFIPDWQPGFALDVRLAALIALLVLVFEFRQRALASAGALMRVQIEVLARQSELDRARLQLLRAQVDPHFLFNTLANVRRLAQIDPRATAEMLGNLIGYFSATLARRDDITALGEEVQLVDAYLRIHRIRMGERLAYEIDVPAELALLSVPAMMLLTLVENAVKHGLNPLNEGGFIRVKAERRGANLLLEVADTGRGMNAVQGHGIGLANTRARLAMLYGARAALSLAHAKPRGVVASILLPTEARA